ncbi:nucleotidyltransferase family protein [Paenibacillus hamazuiensis]|uniref:nucleotidyltransferase family protein n=1 Tax=Paenibacillus hamazuiensis TaxID=2936508 RepID=UPI00200CF1B4|nr:nucleotidyltransferase family protein [Paenibacillus hamazuiensis]
MNVIGIYLAAGQSSRMGTAKLSLELPDGRRLGTLALAEALLSRLAGIVAVTRPGQRLDWWPGSPGGDRHHRAEAGDDEPPELTVNLQRRSEASCPDRPDGPQEASGRLRRTVSIRAAEGMAYSIRAGVEVARERGVNAVLIMLADQPLVTAAWIDALIAAFAEDPGLDFVASSREGKPMPPVLFSARLLDELQRLEGDAGARRLLASPKYRGICVPRSASDFTDVDTPADWETFLALWSRNG